jgi:uncharacterized membrane protein
LQAVDAEALFQLAERGRLLVRMEPAMGEFVLPHAPLAAVWPPSLVDPAVVAAVRQAFVLGPERTLQQDLEFAIRQLVDVAVKALSPSINDPTTARTCVDRLAEVLVNLGNRQPPDPVRRDRSGRVCFVARQTTFARAVALSFDEIRHYGAAQPVLVTHLRETLGRVAELVPPVLRPTLEAQATMLRSDARAVSQGQADRERMGAGGADRAQPNDLLAPVAAESSGAHPNRSQHEGLAFRGRPARLLRHPGP